MATAIGVSGAVTSLGFESAAHPKKAFRSYSLQKSGVPARQSRNGKNMGVTSPVVAGVSSEVSVSTAIRASDFGLMKIDDCGRVLYFSEKPKGDDLKAMQVDTTILGLSPEEADKKPYIASMGIYVFKTNILLGLLSQTYLTANDFGSEIIPASTKEWNVQAYLFNDYWEDIGTIKSFFQANLALGAQVSLCFSQLYEHTYPNQHLCLIMYKHVHRLAC